MLSLPINSEEDEVMVLTLLTRTNNYEVSPCLHKTACYFGKVGLFSFFSVTYRMLIISQNIDYYISI